MTNLTDKITGAIEDDEPTRADDDFATITEMYRARHLADVELSAAEGLPAGSPEQLATLLRGLLIAQLGTLKASIIAAEYATDPPPTSP